VSGVAHELNNPLAGVMAFSELLLASPAGHDAETRPSIETIHAEAVRAAKIVSHLLTFARQQPAERMDADLNAIVTDTLALRRYALRTAQIELDVVLDPALPRAWADRFQLQQVVLNLVGNAEQALADWTGARRIVVCTRHDAEWLVIAVSDTGPGIRPEHRDRIFNPFYTTKPVGQGTGLGLSISDGIVREHGGRIRVESQPGEGATFLVELPVAGQTAAHPGEPTA
jgi:two-component system NtrC family sensor kinase